MAPVATARPGNSLVPPSTKPTQVNQPAMSASRNTLLTHTITGPEERPRSLTPAPSGPTAPLPMVPASPGSNAAATTKTPAVAAPQVSPSEIAARAKFIDPTDSRVRTAIMPSVRTEPSLAQAVRDRLLPDDSDRQIVLPPTHGEPPKIWVAAHKPPAELDARLILLREPDSARAAAYRVLRHRLQDRGNPRIVAVTSPGRGDGKTTCAVNLALALGECERARVLLIEANLRDPQLAALFGFLPPECFAQQMIRHKERPHDPWSVVEAFTPSLHVLAVKPGREAREQALLDGPAFLSAVFSLARGDYEYLVLDTPPVLGSADVNLVEDAADGLLITARAGQTSTRDVRRAVQQLAPAKILGFTLIDA